MAFFLFVFVVLLLNLRVWWKLCNAFWKGSAVGTWLSLAVVLALFLMPVFLRIIPVPKSFERWLEQASWVWLAWSFWMCFVLLLFDLWNVALWGLSYIPNYNDVLRFFAGDKLSACVAIAFTIIATIWGVIEANSIVLHTVEIKTDKLPENVGEYRIAFVSDIHLGPAATERRVHKTIALLEQTKADVLVSAGDLVDGHSDREVALAKLLGSANVAQGKWFAVSGNHDCYSGLDFSRTMHDLAGFKLLRNASELVDGWLWIYGEDDPASGSKMAERISGCPEGCFALFLRHRPTWGGGDLQLSGHSHGGQIFPFNFLVRLQHPYKDSRLHKIEKGYMYVSMGTGVWGPPFRVLARPEVTLFVLKKST